MIRRMIIVFLCICILTATVSLNANAYSVPNSTMYVKTKYVNARLTLEGNKAKGTVEAGAFSRSSITITMKLQKKVNGSWSTINTWMLSGANVLSLTLTKTTQISRGTYRIQGVVNTDGEIVTKNSVSKTY